MTNLSYGSRGDDVKKLQELLNGQGYSLDVDGKFGGKTQAAVKNYQTKNNLKVDGIVGTQTYGALTGGTASAAAPKAAAAPAAPARPVYTQSGALNTANQAVSDWEQAKPGAYTSSYESQIDELLEKVLNGEKFSYDVNADILYQQYKDQYTKLGQRAMQDTQGQAAALTGGYGSSYGVTAGSQAYQDYLSKLLDKIPELEDAAYGKYLDEREREKSRLSILAAMEDSEYSKYRDSVSDYWSEGNYLWDKLSDMSDDEWNRFLQSAHEYDSDRDFAFNQSKFDYQKAQDQTAQENWQKEYELAKQNAAKKSSSSSSSSSKSAEKTREERKKEMLQLFEKGIYKYPETYSDFVTMTGYSGIYTEREFAKRKDALKLYGSYKPYIIEMFKEYYFR